MLSLNALSPMLADSRTIDLSESGWIYEQRLSGETDMSGTSRAMLLPMTRPQ